MAVQLIGSEGSFRARPYRLAPTGGSLKPKLARTGLVNAKNVYSNYIIPEHPGGVNPMRTIKVGSLSIGTDSGTLTLIAGPCVIETADLCLHIGRNVAEICRRLGVQYVFKASFDKANRTSASAYRGPGLRLGLEILRHIRDELGVPICTDIHEPEQAQPVAEVADMLQIPAFLCRQTDLIVAAARTGKCINIKKGQFMAPQDMAYAAQKAVAEGNDQVLLTERGTSFGYHTLVVDFTALPLMRDLGFPVCLDATHAVQRPGAADGRSGGDREHIAHLARAGAAVGIDALFLEVHPDPDSAPSDAASMLHLDQLEGLLTGVRDITRVLSKTCRRAEGLQH